VLRQRHEVQTMTERHELSFWDCASEILNRMRDGGVLCTVVDHDGRQNVLTLGWGQIGPFYHEHPVFSIAVAPPRYSWRFIEEIPEFVIAVPDDALKAAATFCGTASGRDLDKFAAVGLTRVPSVHVRAPSILECPINVECRIYASIAPPHTLLTPEHRQHPIEAQHTIYFAEVLATYTYAGREGSAGRSGPGQPSRL
jgi:flavin reductase (DIM6/NTAB) family NADH-FMN oxidoreductase RutF